MNYPSFKVVPEKNLRKINVKARFWAFVPLGYREGNNRG